VWPLGRLLRLCVFVVAIPLAVIGCGDDGGGGSGRGTAANTSGGAGAAGPRLASAAFRDQDGDALPGAGDLLVLSFDAPVDASGLGVGALLLVPGDTLGQAPGLSGGPASHQVTVVLGAAAHLSLYDTYRPGRPQAGRQATVALDVTGHPGAVRGVGGEAARAGLARLIEVPRAERNRAQGHLDRGGYNLYYGQMHSHTLFSDATVGYPSDAYDTARFQGGLDWFAVSDHIEQVYPLPYKWDDTKRMADVRNFDGSFVTLTGYEWGSGLHNPVTPSLYQHANVMSRSMIDLGRSTSLRGFYGQVAALPDDAVGKFNHPGMRSKQDFGITLYFNNWDDHAYDPLGDKHFALVRVMPGKHDQTAAYQPLLDRGWHVAPAYGEDNHRGNWGLSSRRMGVWTDALTRGAILGGMRAMRTFTTTDHTARLRLLAVDAEGPVWMGSTIPHPGPVHLRVECQDADDGFDRIEVVTYAGAIAATQAAAGALSVTSDVVVDPAADAYFFARAVQSDGDVLYSAPLFIDR
jgi:hypothetical protein